MMLSYVLPIKWNGGQPLEEITAYLEMLSPHVQLIIVDGSERESFEQHQQVWSGLGMHLAPAGKFQFINGKVNGVTTGVELASCRHVVIADDDVRYTLAQLQEIDELLHTHELVSPQNYFDPCPWHATWDSSRSLLNLAVAGHDYPGTLAIQRDLFLELGGYDGNVLFENLELIRTIKAGGGQILYRNDLFVRRLPPATGHFWSQRVRQAYDDYAQPARLTFFILLLPMILILTWFAPATLLLLLLAAVAVAEFGRRKYGGQKVFRATCSLFAPAWLMERAICTWLAMFQKLRKGGVTYNRSVIRKAANPVAAIRKRLALLSKVDPE